MRSYPKTGRGRCGRVAELWELIGHPDRKSHKNFRKIIVAGKKSGKTFPVEKQNPEKRFRLKVKIQKTFPVEK